MLKIALVGAPHSGKSQLAAALTASLKSSHEQAIVVIVDTPALQARMDHYDLTLLMGLESITDAREAADQEIRRLLAQAAVPYRVIYGLDEERLDQALHAIEDLLQRAGKPQPQRAGPAGKPGAWVWTCDKCSDPQCEHRLLTDLLAQRARGV